MSSQTLLAGEYASRTIAYAWNTDTLQYEAAILSSDGLLVDVRGGATAAKQDEGSELLASIDAGQDDANAALTSIDGKTPALVSGRSPMVLYYWNPDTLAYQVATVPTAGGGGGDASAAKQDIGNASLASIDGKVPASPATSAKQDTGNTSMGNVDTTLGSQASATWDGSSAAAAVSIWRYLGVKLEAIRAVLASSIAVTGTFWPATQPVSIASMPSTPVTGPLTDTQLRAAAVPVSSATLSTEATLAAVLAKIIAAPATEATLTAIKAKTDNLTADPATQATLAAILAKLITAPATEATLALIKAKTDNLDVALSTRTKPADVQHVDDNGASLTVDGTVGVSNMIPAVETGLAKDVSVAPLIAPAAGGYVRQDSTATMAKETGGNLAAAVASLGDLSARPAAYSVLDRLYQLGLKIDAQAKAGATEATMKQLLLVMKPAPAPSRLTLLHRS